MAQEQDQRFSRSRVSPFEFQQTPSPLERTEIGLARFFTRKAQPYEHISPPVSLRHECIESHFSDWQWSETPTQHFW